VTSYTRVLVGEFSSDVVLRPPPPTLPCGDVVHRPPPRTLPCGNVVRRTPPPTLPRGDVVHRPPPPKCLLATALLDECKGHGLRGTSVISRLFLPRGCGLTALFSNRRLSLPVLLFSLIGKWLVRRPPAYAASPPAAHERSIRLRGAGGQERPRAAVAVSSGEQAIHRDDGGGATGR